MAFFRTLTRSRGLFIYISIVLILVLFVLYRLSPQGLKTIMAAKSQNTSSTLDPNGIFHRSVTTVTVQLQTTSYTLEPYGIFSVTMSDAERDTLMKIFRKLLQVYISNNITMFLHAGSMIGAYRHHGIIPWDTDIDVITNDSQRQLTWNVTNNITGLYLDNFSSKIWKLYAIPEHSGPFVDIFFFTENSTHIYVAMNHRRTFWQRKELVFPLQMRPFGNVFASVPCNIVKYVKRAYRYPIDQCPYRFIRHNKTIQRMVPCSALSEQYDFVNRTTMREGVVLEELIHGQIKKQAFTLPDFC